ncbi:MAG TPA: nucleotidyltransferase family protein [Candidatus Moranbacteria bacterium]|nr:nucleotidyltransferase family protein [Candidatus Moranbacteria bacterium]HRZ33947.1 nucleotidyltransferase family protein [Candidatus Moranbacteria bacterium]
MQAVILAAGKGTRMQPLTYDIPKAMLLVKEKPILEYTINFLPEIVDEVIIVINHLGDQIQKYFGDEFNGRKIKYVVQEKLNGTGGAVHTCKDLLKGKFMVVMGDDLYYKEDLKDLLNYELAILAFEVEDSTRFGVLKTDESGHLIEIIEKPQLKEKALISTNAFVLNEKFFDYDLVPISETEFGLPQTLAKMAQDYPVKILQALQWLPVGYPEDIKKAEEVIDKFI